MQQVLFVSKSGILLFSRTLQSVRGRETSDQSISSLLTAMLQLSKDTVGAIPSYMEISEGAISFCRDDYETGILCALFHDLTVSEGLGNVLTAEILHSFIEDNRKTIVTTGRASLMATYQFSDRRIAQSVRNAMTTILDNLQDEPGIRICGLSNQETCDPFFTRVAVNQHALDANITGIIENAAFLLGKLSDGLDNISMAMGATTAHFIKVDEEAWFVVVSDLLLFSPNVLYERANILKKAYSIAESLA
eukprot:CFRG6086T1